MIALAAAFWPALLGLGFVAVLLVAIWRTRDRMGWLQALAALAVITFCALIFWRSWVLLAMLVVMAALTVRAMRLPPAGETSSAPNR